MPRNPYVASWQRRRANQRRAESPGLAAGRWIAPFLAAALLVPFTRPVLMSYLDGPAVHWGEGTEALLDRLVLVVVGVLALDVYTALIRGPDRQVLDLLPVDAARVAAYELRRVAYERLWLVPATAIGIAPIAAADPALWALAVAVLAGAFAVGLFVSAAVHLGAVNVATDERWAGLLDLLRGSNPRLQAAFLWAPGVVLLVAGGVSIAAARGVPLLRAGDPAGLAWLLLPWPVAALAAWPIGDLARRTWFLAGAIIADIDARYAALEGRSEGLRVYLDWAVRFLPVTVARYALQDLRHGWRSRRAWLTGAWLAGVVAALVGWAGDDDAPARAAAVVTAAVFVCGTIGVLLERDEPVFLRAWLPDPGPAGALGRAFVLCAWLQACVWPAAIAVAVRHELADAGRVLLVGLAAVGGATLLAVTCGRLRERAVFAYGPAAALAAAGLAAFAGARG